MVPLQNRISFLSSQGMSSASCSGVKRLSTLKRFGYMISLKQSSMFVMENKGKRSLCGPNAGPDFLQWWSKTINYQCQQLLINNHLCTCLCNPGSSDSGSRNFYLNSWRAKHSLSLVNRKHFCFARMTLVACLLLMLVSHVDAAYCKSLLCRKHISMPLEIWNSWRAHKACSLSRVKSRKYYVRGQ